MYHGVLIWLIFIKHNGMSYVKIMSLLLHWAYIIKQLTTTLHVMVTCSWLAHNWALLHNSSLFMASQELTPWNPTDYIKTCFRLSTCGQGLVRLFDNVWTIARWVIWQRVDSVSLDYLTTCGQGLARLFLRCLFN